MIRFARVPLDLLARTGHPVFQLVDRGRLSAAVREAAPQTTPASRSGLEHALDLPVWFDMYAPGITLA